MADTNAQIAQQIQLKHQFYLLTLCFTVLALAVETPDFKGSVAADTSELAGLVTKIEANLARADEAISHRNEKITAQYLLHRWLFVAGVVLLVISRGYEPAARTLGVLCSNLG